MPGVPVSMYSDLKMGLPAKGSLRRRWQQSRPDIVHVATEGPFGWSACSAARALDIPVTSDFRTRFERYDGISTVRTCTPLVRAYLRIFHNRVARTFVPTEELRAELSRHGFSNLVVSGRGIDSIAFAPTYRSETLRRQWKANGPVALYVGRLAAEKNLLTVINAFEAMRSMEPDTRLVIVGDGPMREEISQRCPEAIFANMQRGAALATYYASADIFLFPNLDETFSSVPLEAMASGLAVVAYHAATAAMYIEDGESGLTAQRGNEDEFIAAAVCLAQDEKFRERVGWKARIAARKAGWDRIHSEFETTLLAAAKSENCEARACPGLA
jgi:glycosyltransferase involved in cell wall biosynthesis